MKKREEQQKKMEELDELPPRMRWFHSRTRKPVPSLRVAPGVDPSLKTVVDGFEKFAF